MGPVKRQRHNNSRLRGKRTTSSGKTVNRGVDLPKSYVTARYQLPGMMKLTEELSVCLQYLHATTKDHYPSVLPPPDTSDTSQTLSAEMYKSKNIKGVEDIILEVQSCGKRPGDIPKIVARFKFPHDTCQWGIRVFPSIRAFEVWRLEPEKPFRVWILGLCDSHSNPKLKKGMLSNALRFWNIVCHQFQMMTLRELGYINLPRQIDIPNERRPRVTNSLIQLRPERDAPDPIESADLETMSIVIPGRKTIHFTNHLVKNKKFVELVKQYRLGQTNEEADKKKKGRSKRMSRSMR